MIEQITELIKQHLPQQVGAALVSELEELTELRELFKRQKDKIENLEGQLKEYHAMEAKYNSLSEREKSCEIREKAIERLEIEEAVRWVLPIGGSVG